MKKLIILDFSTGECHSYPIEASRGGEDELIALGFKPSQCQWMITGELIFIH